MGTEDLDVRKSVDDRRPDRLRRSTPGVVAQRRYSQELATAEGNRCRHRPRAAAQERLDHLTTDSGELIGTLMMNATAMLVELQPATAGSRFRTDGISGVTDPERLPTPHSTPVRRAGVLAPHSDVVKTVTDIRGHDANLE